MFLDYFDGEPAGIAKKLRGRESSPSVMVHVPAHCRDCDCAMELQSYLETGPSIFRCTGCMATFATPEMLDALARFALPQPQGQEPSLLATIRAWLGR